MATEFSDSKDMKLLMANSNLEDSWVHIDSPSRGSSCSSITSCTDKLTDANSSKYSSQVEGYEDMGSNLDAEKFRLARQVLPRIYDKNVSDAIDWDSRCEAYPPRRYPYSNIVNEEQLLSPPNSPVSSDDLLLVFDRKFYHDWSFRHSKYIRHNWFSVEVLFAFLASNVLSFIAGGIAVR